MLNEMIDDLDEIDVPVKVVEALKIAQEAASRKHPQFLVIGCQRVRIEDRKTIVLKELPPRKKQPLTIYRFEHR